MMITMRCLASVGALVFGLVAIPAQAADAPASDHVDRKAAKEAATDAFDKMLDMPRGELFARLGRRLDARQDGGQ